MCRVFDFLSKFLVGMSAAMLVLQHNMAAAGDFPNALRNQKGLFNPVTNTQVQFESLQNVNNPSVVDAYVDIFANNIYHLSQQQGSLLMPFVLVEGMVMNAKSINRIGALEQPSLYMGRGSQVIATNPDQDVRWLTAQRYWLACFIDQYDQIRTLFDIRNAYTSAMSMSFGRMYDRVIIAAALGDVWTGPNKSKKVSLPMAQRFCATDGTATTGTGLNVETLRVVRKRMKKSFAAKRGQQIVFVISAEESDSLLREAQTTNRDYTCLLYTSPSPRD